MSGKNIAYIHLKIRFSEVDKHGHVYNGAYFSYFEEGIIEFCQKYGLLKKNNYPNDIPPIFYVHSVKIRYLIPVKFNQNISIKTSIVEVTNSGLKFQGVAQSDEIEHAVSEVIWVNVDPKSMQKKPHNKDFLDLINKVL